jgi:hypothetical protein
MPDKRLYQYAHPEERAAYYSSAFQFFDQQATISKLIGEPAQDHP